MSPIGTNRRLEVGQSMSALPGYFRHQLVPLLPRRHRPQCRDTGPCFRSWYARARVGQPSGCPSADRLRWLLFVAVNASQTASGPVRRFRSIPTRAAHTGALLWCGSDRGGQGRRPKGLADSFGCSRVGIVPFPEGTYCQSGAWYPSPSLLGFYR